MLNVNVECQISACLVRMIWVKDQHAQAQQWLMHAQAWAQAQAQAQLQRKRLAAEHADLGYNIWKLRWTSPFELMGKTDISKFQHMDFV